jgi:putative transposase
MCVGREGSFLAKSMLGGLLSNVLNMGVKSKKDLSVRVHHCFRCGYKTDGDVAAGQNIRNRGIKLISTVGQTGIESACADDLPGVEVTQFRQVSKSRKRVTRKSQK